MRKELFDEFYDDPKKVVGQLQHYLMETNRTPTDIAGEIGVSAMTLIRILRGNNKMFLSTWCKLKRFMSDKT